ncbi:conserved hypothetical protein [Uncinocarpus reesii 1704]|uniref:rRNA methyltransferase 2, mitochondrial n=1 Tax=Uncinocarpus reesii (strain UAMH 1704) TaxID=336963 RepID=C4JT96_UNCRE|nr:uncharacterized protein UREG_05685 [Uncinocarpus reesii 1704]EEP80843.1 conserved hypothetical protein [Uncinocarpus reesii 1704]
MPFSKGFAPGSWSQVAVELTHPNGRVLGIDIIPAQPPKGVSTIQGNFLSPRVQAYVREFLRNPERGRPRRENCIPTSNREQPTVKNEVEGFEPGYIDRERGKSELITEEPCVDDTSPMFGNDGTVDVVLSDMSAPWQPTTGFWKRSLNDPYHRMLNTSGLNVRDHSGSMGSEDQLLENRLRSLFQKVYREKPDSSRKVGPSIPFIHVLD